MLSETDQNLTEVTEMALLRVLQQQSPWVNSISLERLRVTAKAEAPE